MTSQWNIYIYIYTLLHAGGNKILSLLCSRVMANACYIAEWKGGCDLPEVSKPAFQSWKLERMAWHLHITIPPRAMHTFHTFWCILNNQSGILLYSLGTTLCPTFIVDLIFTFGKMPCDRLFPEPECHWSRRFALTLHNFCGFGRWRWCRALSCSPNITGCSIEMILWLFAIIYCNNLLGIFQGSRI